MAQPNLFHIGFEVLTAVAMKSSIFWDITLCSPLKVSQHFGELLPVFMLVSCLAYCLALEIEATCSSEMLVDFQRTTQHCIPEDRTL
jgi:hypothetical protein